MPQRLWSCEPGPAGSRRVSSRLLPQFDNFELGQHADGACSGLVFRYYQAKAALSAEQRLAICGVRPQNLVVDEGRIQFAQREQHLIPILRFGEDVAGQYLAAQFASLRNTRALQNFIQPYALVDSLHSIVGGANRSEEHTSELQSLRHLVCRLLL